MQASELNKYVVTSRIRLARNLSDIPFPSKLNFDKAQKVIESVSEPLVKSARCKLFRLKDLSDIEVEAMKEKRLISPLLADNRQISAVGLNNDNTLAVMINEEDHIRIQVIYQGLELDKAYAFASKADKLIDESNDIAFDHNLGYLTACPTNLGTGLRASVMMFLPGLILNKTIDNLILSMSKDFMTFRGIYGEGTNNEGFLYQLSNQYTLGIKEEDIIEKVRVTIHKIAEAEEMARNTKFKNRRADIMDMCLRAYGILTNAVKINSSEFLNCMSLVRLGVCLGFIDVKIEELDKMIEDYQPAALSLKEGRELDAEERDELRAAYVKESFKKLAGKI